MHGEPKLSGGQILAINVNHSNRLLLEDIMLLNKGEKVLLISSNHEILKRKGGNLRFTRNILQSVEIDAMRPQPFQKQLIYFACNLEVSGNPT